MRRPDSNEADTVRVGRRHRLSRRPVELQPNCTSHLGFSRGAGPRSIGERRLGALIGGKRTAPWSSALLSVLVDAELVVLGIGEHGPDESWRLMLGRDCRSEPDKAGSYAVRASTEVDMYAVLPRPRFGHPLEPDHWATILIPRPTGSDQLRAEDLRPARGRGRRGTVSFCRRGQSCSGTAESDLAEEQTW